MEDSVGGDDVEELSEVEELGQDNVGHAVTCRVGDEQRDRGDH